jgi:hypothetical protein
VLIESKQILHYLNEHNEVLELSFLKFQRQYSVLDEYFITGAIAGFLAKQDPTVAFSWGLSMALSHFDIQHKNKLELINFANTLKWKKAFIDKF